MDESSWARVKRENVEFGQKKRDRQEVKCEANEMKKPPKMWSLGKSIGRTLSYI